MTTLTTPRLRLRPFVDADLDLLLDLYSRPEVVRWIGDGRPETTRQQAEARLRRYQGLDHPVHGIWAITPADDGTAPALGTLLLKPLPASGEPPLQPSGEIEIGWHLHPRAWGRGYATEAAGAALAHAWAHDLPRVVAVTHPDNAASQAVCARLGMAALGLTDAYYNATCSLFAIGRPSSRGSEPTA